MLTFGFARLEVAGDTAASDPDLNCTMSFDPIGYIYCPDVRLK